MASKTATLSLLTVLVLVPATSRAQSLTDYLEDRAHAALRVEVALPGGIRRSDRSFFDVLRSFLGVRGKRYIRPKVGTKFIVYSSAYASSPYQTDSTPCITSAGTRVRPGVVASNFLPLGTLLDINGDEYIVEDRMNPRFRGYFLDIWFPSTSEALDWGSKRLEITVIGYSKPGLPIRESQKGENLIVDDRAKEDKGGFIGQVREGMSRIGLLLGARRSADYVNRFDVDCLEE